MGSCNKDNIINSYNYIYSLLTNNHNYIIKKNLYAIISNDEDLKKLIDLKALHDVINQY
jgi:hypothetical protein